MSGMEFPHYQFFHLFMFSSSKYFLNFHLIMKKKMFREGHMENFMCKDY